jgi:apolipoprotein N-acyltransferase
MLEGAAQRIALRRSFVMRAALWGFVLTATWAVFTGIAPCLGVWQAAPLTLAVAALLALCAVRHERAQPVALKLGGNTLSAWDRAGALLAHGRIAGCSQWSDRLLVLALVQENGRRRSLLLTADALPATVFRELSVLGRRGAGA